MTSFYRLGQKYKNIVVRFFVQIKTLKFAFEIYWPLGQEQLIMLLKNSKQSHTYLSRYKKKFDATLFLEWWISDQETRKLKPRLSSFLPLYRCICKYVSMPPRSIRVMNIKPYAATLSAIYLHLFYGNYQHTVHKCSVYYTRYMYILLIYCKCINAKELLRSGVKKRKTRTRIIAFFKVKKKKNRTLPQD